MDDVPTGITPKKKTWNVPQTWERTEPREALLEAFRRRREEGDVPSPAMEEPLALPTVASVESIPSIGSQASLSSLGLGVSQTQMQMPTKVRKPSGNATGYSKLDGGILAATGKDKDRVVIPLGEAGGNIPVPAPRRARK